MFNVIFLNNISIKYKYLIKTSQSDCTITTTQTKKVEMLYIELKILNLGSFEKDTTLQNAPPYFLVYLWNCNFKIQ